jgi:hypothetical protein
MRHSTNRDNSQVTRLNFRNGWTASIVSKGAASECAVWPTSRHPGDDWVDHVHSDATDDEVAEFLVSVRRRTTFTAHYHSDATPQIPSQSDETISRGDIRRQLEQLNRKIDHMTLNLDRLSADVTALTIAEKNILSLLTTVLTQQQTTLAELAQARADLAAAIAANDPEAQKAAQDQIDAIASQLEAGTQSLVDMVAEHTPPTEPVPVEAPAEAPVQ